MQEFSLIAKYFAPLAKGFEGAFGLTDDAAILHLNQSYDLVATKDALAAGIHFFPDDAPEDVARKLIRVNLSDLAAMGAKPVGFLLGLVMPKSTSEAWLAAFSATLQEDMERFGGVLIGGDTVTHDGPLVLTLTALGAVKGGKAITRAGAKIGDDIYVTGTIGDSYLGLNLLNKTLKTTSREDFRFLAGRYHKPRPRMNIGRKLVMLASACIDVSDGLMADLGHICECSKVGAEIRFKSIPLSAAAQNLITLYPEQHLKLVSGGDDYELLFTAHPDHAAKIAAIAEKQNIPITKIGTITSGSAPHLFDGEGKEITVVKGGYEHNVG